MWEKHLKMVMLWLYADAHCSLVYYRKIIFFVTGWRYGCWWEFYLLFQVSYGVNILFILDFYVISDIAKVNEFPEMFSEVFNCSNIIVDCVPLSKFLWEKVESLHVKGFELDKFHLHYILYDNSYPHLLNIL